ncbi:hypothetical protein E2562_018092 [Oryza meyeriana var. granulata]|uniref:Uncharacterized protein n=1 Tax=Oryza meyeriana var. granulata TaxID=110450 RepID=A0A6G1CQ45_9ORYZ|nr:hypothetical protein E2562_018092 [Oryza meyeriana var. granulata]
MYIQLCCLPTIRRFALTEPPYHPTFPFGANLGRRLPVHRASSAVTTGSHGRVDLRTPCLYVIPSASTITSVIVAESTTLSRRSTRHSRAP